MRVDLGPRIGTNVGSTAPHDSTAITNSDTSQFDNSDYFPKKLAPQR
jgi:hypothetical protein